MIPILSLPVPSKLSQEWSGRKLFSVHAYLACRLCACLPAQLTACLGLSGSLLSQTLGAAQKLANCSPGLGQ